MPYLWWQGTTITGDLFSGYVFAPSTQYLEKQLFKQHIALIKTKDCSFLMHRYAISITDKAELYVQLATLLENGVQLAPAFMLIAQQLANPKIQKILFVCGAEIEAGNNINSTLIKHELLFDTLACQTIAVGLETGKLTIVCKMLSTYYETQVAFKSKMRSVLLTPAITGLCLLLVALLVFIFFIPKLSSLFATLNVAMPASTQLLISISNFTRSTSMLYAAAIIVGLSIAFVVLRKKSLYVQKISTAFYYHTPFIRLIMNAHAQATFFSFLSILLKSDIPLPQALTIIADILPKGRLQHTVEILHEQVEAGNTIVSAMSSQLPFFDAHQIAIIAIAQETACLPAAVENMAKKSFKRIDTLIAYVVFWTGPLLLLILGICVAGLMIAIYSPLINLSAGLH